MTVLDGPTATACEWSLRRLGLQRARAGEHSVAPRRYRRRRRDLHQRQEIDEGEIADLGRGELLADQILLAGELSLEDRQVLLDCRLGLGHRRLVPTFLRQEALGKDDRAGMPGHLQIT